MSITEKTEFDKLWNYNDPEATGKKFREIEEEVRSSGNQSHYLQLLTQIARTYSLRRMFDEAHKLLDEVEPQIDDSMPRAKVRYYLERGRTFNSSGVFEKARDNFLKALEIAQACGEENLAVDAAHMMGIVEKGDASVKWNEKAMQVAENSKDEQARNWLGALYNNLGWTYFDMKQYDCALELFRKDAVWYDSKERTTEANIARWSESKTLRVMGKTDEALAIQLKLLEVCEKTSSPDGYNFEELAECYLIKGDNEEAKKFAAKAYEILSQDGWLKANETERLDRLKELGGVA